MANYKPYTTRKIRAGSIEERSPLLSSEESPLLSSSSPKINCDESTSSSSSCCHGLTSYVPIELLLLGYTVSRVLLMGMTGYYLFDQASKMYGDPSMDSLNPCGNSHSHAKDREKAENVQKEFVQLSVISTVSDFIPAVIPTIFIGPATDIWGRRLGFVLPLLGTCARAVVFLFVLGTGASFYYIYIGTVLEGLGGGFGTFLMTSFAAAADITTPGPQRGLRICVIEVINILGSSAAGVAGGHWRKTGYVQPAVCAAVIGVVSLLYALWFWPETRLVGQTSPGKISHYARECDADTHTETRDPEPALLTHTEKCVCERALDTATENFDCDTVTPTPVAFCGCFPAATAEDTQRFRLDPKTIENIDNCHSDSVTSTAIVTCGGYNAVTAKDTQRSGCDSEIIKHIEDSEIGGSGFGHSDSDPAKSTRTHVVECHNYHPATVSCDTNFNRSEPGAETSAAFQSASRGHSNVSTLDNTAVSKTPIHPITNKDSHQASEDADDLSPGQMDSIVQYPQITVDTAKASTTGFKEQGKKNYGSIGDSTSHNCLRATQNSPYNVISHSETDKTNNPVHSANVGINNSDLFANSGNFGTSEAEIIVHPGNNGFRDIEFEGDRSAAGAGTHAHAHAYESLCHIAPAVDPRESWAVPSTLGSCRGRTVEGRRHTERREVNDERETRNVDHNEKRRGKKDKTVSPTLPNSVSLTPETSTSCCTTVASAAQTSWNVYFRSDSTSHPARRRVLCLCFFSFLLTVGVNFAKPSVEESFRMSQLCWNAVKESEFCSAWLVAHWVCILLMLRVLQRHWQIHDVFIAMIGCSSGIAALFVFCFATLKDISPWVAEVLVYASAGGGSVARALIPMLRSMSSSVVSRDEQGALFVSYASVELAGAAIFDLIGGQIFKATVHIWAGIVFVMWIVFLVVVLGLLIKLATVLKRYSQDSHLGV